MISLIAIAIVKSVHVELQGQGSAPLKDTIHKRQAILLSKGLFGSMYLTQIRSKAATGFNWQSLFASAAINMIARFQKQPFLQTSPICVKYILPRTKTKICVIYLLPGLLFYGDRSLFRPRLSWRMAYSRLNQPESARLELAAGREPIENRLPDGPEKIVDLGRASTGVWHDWVIAYFLLHEAEMLGNSTFLSARFSSAFFEFPFSYNELAPDILNLLSWVKKI